MSKATEQAATAAACDVPALLNAILDHAAALEAWLSKPPPEPDGFLAGADAKLVDFTPLESWIKVLAVCGEAEIRAAPVTAKNSTG